MFYLECSRTNVLGYFEPFDIIISLYTVKREASIWFVLCLVARFKQKPSSYRPELFRFPFIVPGLSSLESFCPRKTVVAKIWGRKHRLVFPFMRLPKNSLPISPV